MRLVRQLRAELGTDHGTVQRVAEPARLWRRVGAHRGSRTRRRRRHRWRGRAAGRDRIDGPDRALEQEHRELRRPTRSWGRLRLFREAELDRPSVIVAFVDGHRAEFGVEPICTTLGVAPSTYWSAKSRGRPVGSRRTRRCVAGVDGVVGANRKVYGAHKLWKAARRRPRCRP